MSAWRCQEGQEDEGEEEDALMLSDDPASAAPEATDELAALRRLEVLTTGSGEARPLPDAARCYFVYAWDAPSIWQSWRVGRRGSDGRWQQRPRDRSFPFTEDGEKEALRYAVCSNLVLARQWGHRWGCVDLDGWEAPS